MFFDFEFESFFTGTFISPFNFLITLPCSSTFLSRSFILVSKSAFTCCFFVCCFFCFFDFFGLSSFSSKQNFLLRYAQTPNPINAKANKQQMMIPAMHLSKNMKTNEMTTAIPNADRTSHQY